MVSFKFSLIFLLSAASLTCWSAVAPDSSRRHSESRMPTWLNDRWRMVLKITKCQIEEKRRKLAMAASGKMEAIRGDVVITEVRVSLAVTVATEDNKNAMKGIATCEQSTPFSPCLQRICRCGSRCLRRTIMKASLH
ncbi:unnamed protein product [Dicrocoelium dendriticum]|nr:unnamed protein product [Dicrocoelium dendriticum]